MADLFVTISSQRPVVRLLPANSVQDFESTPSVRRWMGDGDALDWLGRKLTLVASSPYLVQRWTAPGVKVRLHLDIDVPVELPGSLVIPRAIYFKDRVQVRALVDVYRAVPVQFAAEG